MRRVKKHEKCYDIVLLTELLKKWGVAAFMAIEDQQTVYTRYMALFMLIKEFDPI